MGIEDFVWVNYVNKVVGYAFSIGDGWFGRADVEAAVDLAGVGGDDFDGGVVGELEGKAGLAGGGGAGDDEEGWAWGFRLFGRQGPLSQLSEVCKTLEHTREAAGAVLPDDVRRDSWGRMCKSGSVIPSGEMRGERGDMGDT